MKLNFEIKSFHAELLLEAGVPSLLVPPLSSSGRGHMDETK